MGVVNVRRIRGLYISTTAPTDGQALTYVAATSSYTPTTLAGAAFLGALTVGLAWTTGLGAISHILGPTDQPLKIASGAGQPITLAPVSGQNINLTPAGAGLISAGSQVAFPTGLGVISHLLGPTDQPFKIASGAGQPLTLAPVSGQNLNLNPAGAGVISHGAQIFFPTGLGAITHLLGPTDQPLLIASGAGRAVTIQPPSGQNINLTCGGAGVIQATGALAGFQSAVTASASGPITLTVAQSGLISLNTGAAGQVVYNLPASAVGLNYAFYVDVAQNIRIAGNGAEQIRVAASISTATTGHIDNATIGSWIILTCVKVGLWVAEGAQGTWTVT